MPFLCICSKAFISWYMYSFTLLSGKWCRLPLIHSYKFWSISSKTSAKRPVGSSLHTAYYRISINLTICGCGESRRRAWISLRLLTWSRELKWFFMHLMATNLPVLMLWALRTSLKVPSPFLEIRRYSGWEVLCIDGGVYWNYKGGGFFQSKLHRN